VREKRSREDQQPFPVVDLPIRTYVYLEKRAITTPWVARWNWRHRGGNRGGRVASVGGDMLDLIRQLTAMETLGRMGEAHSTPPINLI
jgi:hypothetical protein